MKICSKCRESYPATSEFFYRHCGHRDGLAGQCKKCVVANREKINENQRNRRRDNPEKDSAWIRKDRMEHPEKYEEINRRRREEYKQNPEPHRRSSREYSRQNPEARNARARRYRERNPEKKRKNARRYYRENPDKFATYRAREREQSQWRVSNSMRAGIYLSLKSGKNGHRWESLVGYTCEELMAHLESQFTKGMTWENYGEWHIDHIKPISHFCYENYGELEFLECWSLWNLQPLWAFDNHSKNNRIDEVPLPLLHKVDSQP